MTRERRKIYLAESGSGVMKIAGKKADDFNHNYISTEHVLLGVLGVNKVGLLALTNLGIDPSLVNAAVSIVIGEGDGRLAGEKKLTPLANDALRTAVSEARSLHHISGNELIYLEDHHILLGLATGEGIAAGILDTLGARIRALRGEVLRNCGLPVTKPLYSDPEIAQRRMIEEFNSLVNNDLIPRTAKEEALQSLAGINQELQKYLPNGRNIRN